MARHQYIVKRIGPDKLAIINAANEIFEEYEDQGYELTLRQVYYQFVARNLFPESWIDPAYNAKQGLDADTSNTIKSYNRLGDTLGDGRMAGLVDWNHLVDRTRSVKCLSHWIGPADVIMSAAKWFNLDLWARQKERVEVWIEKDALIGVISGVCNSNDIPHFSCRGYVSLSEMYVASRRIIANAGQNQHTTILHLGDHDPSGVNMTDDIENRLAMMVRPHTGSAAVFTVKRIALTPEQVLQYKPPPQPAKKSDSRYKAYVKQTGFKKSWELDALEPAVLNALIDKEIKEIRDDDLWLEGLDEEILHRKQLTAASYQWDEFEDQLDVDNISLSGNEDDDDDEDED